MSTASELWCKGVDSDLKEIKDELALVKKQLQDITIRQQDLIKYLAVGLLGIVAAIVGVQIAV